MKKFRATRHSLYDSLMLFREDLEEVIRLFNPTNAPDGIVISDGGAEYDSLDEMQSQKGDRICELKIKGRTPAIVLDLRANPKYLSLSTLQSTDEADIAYFKVNEFLRPKRRWLNTVLDKYVFLISLVALFLIGLTPKVKTLLDTYHISWWVYVPLGIIAGILSYNLDQRTALFISLKKRHESTSFLERKKDDLLMLLIGTLLGIIASQLVQHFRR